MNLGALKGVIGAVAPSLATAMGSPLAGAAMSAIADKLGVKNEPKEIEKAIQSATPEQLVAIKEAELDFEGALVSWGFGVPLFKFNTKPGQKPTRFCCGGETLDYEGRHFPPSVL